LPKELTIIDDVACAFNLVYGHGMTTATLGTETLDEYMREQL
jgi:hypothetical protein